MKHIILTTLLLNVVIFAYNNTSQVLTIYIDYLHSTTLNKVFSIFVFENQT